MSLNTNTKSQGFTIVELLIVVVVIAILAAITIVSYNGITNRANASAAQSSAATVQKKAELYAADASASTGYPNTFSDLTSAAASTTYYIASGSIDLATSAAGVTSGNGKKTVALEVCGTPVGVAADKTTVTGIKIHYFNFTAGTGTSTVTVGDTNTPANCEFAQT